MNGRHYSFSTADLLSFVALQVDALYLFLVASGVVMEGTTRAQNQGTAVSPGPTAQHIGASTASSTAVTLTSMETAFASSFANNFIDHLFVFDALTFTLCSCGSSNSWGDPCDSYCSG